MEITSNYTGTDLTVFGAIEAGRNWKRARANHRRRGARTRRHDDGAPQGPHRGRLDQQRARPACRHAVLLLPGLHAAAGRRSRRPTRCSRYDLGLDNLRPETALSDGSIVPYVRALVRAEVKSGLYAQNTRGRRDAEPDAVPRARSGSRRRAARLVHRAGLSVPRRRGDQRAIDAAVTSTRPASSAGSIDFAHQLAVVSTASRPS